MRVLVTGAGGFIGRYLVEVLSAVHDVIAVCRPGAACPSTVTCAPADLGAPDFERGLPKDIDAVVHLAQSGRYREFPDGAPDMFAINVASTFRLLHFAANSNAGRFVLVSSGAVYEPFDGNLNEDQRIAPRSMYAVSKAAAELLAEPFREQMAVACLRVFFPYGAGQTRRLVPELAHRIRHGQPVTLDGAQGDGTVLSLMHVDDVVGVIGKALDEGWSSVTNVASAETVSIRALAQMLGERLGKEVHFDFQPNRSPGNIRPSLDRLRARVKISEFKPLDTGLSELVEQEDWRNG